MAFQKYRDNDQWHLRNAGALISGTLVSTTCILENNTANAHSDSYSLSLLSLLSLLTPPLAKDTRL